MKLFQRAAATWIILFVLSVFYWACNPVKKVLKDQQKFDQVAKEVIRRGYCVNDTTKVDSVTSVSVFSKDSLIHDTVPILVAMGGNLQPLDTILASGAHIKINADGDIDVACPVKQVQTVKTVTQNNYIRDLSKEKLLLGDINDLTLAKQDLQKRIDTQDVQIKSLKQKVFFRTIEAIGILLAIVVYLVVKSYSNIKKLLPFLP
jgi:hypothetical protein